MAYLARFFANFSPVQVPMVRLVDNLPQAVKSKDVITHTTSSSRLHFVLVAKQFLTCKTTSIV